MNENDDLYEGLVRDDKVDWLELEPPITGLSLARTALFLAFWAWIAFLLFGGLK